jgi:hypothetical protein
MTRVTTIRTSFLQYFHRFFGSRSLFSFGLIFFPSDIKTPIADPHFFSSVLGFGKLMQNRPIPDPQHILTVTSGSQKLNTDLP